MGILGKKSEAGATIAVILIIALFLGWLINVTQRECRTNKDCGSEFYCGSDFACHEFPTIEKTIVQNNFLIPSLIIGIAIIIGVVIFRWDKLRKEKPVAEQVEPVKEVRQKEVSEEDVEPYYKSQNNIKV